jgi:hypothetical protein
MMGRLSHDQEQFFYSFRLDEAVPEDHAVREIAAVLDLSWALPPRHGARGGMRPGSWWRRGGRSGGEEPRPQNAENGEHRASV